MKCPKCGSENSPEAAACALCRARLLVPVEVHEEVPAAAPVILERRPCSSRTPAIIGALFTLAGNGAFLLFWASREARLGDRFFELLGMTSILVGPVGYYLGSKIAARPSYPIGFLFGLLGGAITGAVNGTAVYPVIGTVIGAIMGAIVGLVAGPVLVAIARARGNNG